MADLLLYFLCALCSLLSHLAVLEMFNLELGAWIFGPFILTFSPSQVSLVSAEVTTSLLEDWRLHTLAISSILILIGRRLGVSIQF